MEDESLFEEPKPEENPEASEEEAWGWNEAWKHGRVRGRKTSGEEGVELGPQPYLESRLYEADVRGYSPKPEPSYTPTKSPERIRRQTAPKRVETESLETTAELLAGCKPEAISSAVAMIRRTQTGEYLRKEEMIDIFRSFERAGIPVQDFYRGKDYRGLRSGQMFVFFKQIASRLEAYALREGLAPEFDS